MKHRFTKILSCLLALIMLSASLVSCTPASDEAVITYGDYKVSRAVFRYLCCTEKTSYLYEAYGITPNDLSSSQLQDNPQIWAAKDSEGTTVADTLKMQVLETLQTYLYFCQYAKDQGYELNREQEDMVKNEFASLIASSFDDKKEFNANMKPYGINYDQMLEYNMIQALAYQGEELLFGENGPSRITKDAAKRYFKANYITVDCIFINTANKTYPNGKVVVLPQEEKDAKIALAQDLENRLGQGEDFTALCREYADQPMEADTPEKGYTFEKGGFMNAEAEEKAFAMAEGELARVDVEGGTYLIRRRALDQDVFEDQSNAVIALLKSAKKTALIADAQKDFKLDEAFLDELDIATLPHLV
ncbi:MAG: peptidylprolyl isomerase [Clostridia bacterium]|nr:peptidylprolyl isomerase [Clostridia bacterium]